jgi:pyocin large subunit-like protein
MTTVRMVFALAATAVLGLAACDRNPAGEPAREQAASSAETVPSPDAADAAATESAERRASARTDPRQQAVPVHDDGTPVWAPNSRRTAMENAERQFERNGKAFGATTVDQYVDRVHAFIGNPPKGTLTHTRSNGDKLLYDPKGNVFAVATKDGAPRTMFKPDDGMAYWEKQKQSQARRRSGNAEG